MALQSYQDQWVTIGEKTGLRDGGTYLGQMLLLAAPFLEKLH
jgi:hypothetical protein